MEKDQLQNLPLVGRGEISLADALEEEDNMLIRLAYPKQRFEFFVWIELRRNDFAKLVHRDLGLEPGTTCELSHSREWIHGSFNVCIPVYIHNWKRHPGRRVLLRLPLCYKTGDVQYPGNTDEKLRTEAATYLWMKHACPDVPVPRLWAFGFPGGQSFILVENAPLITQVQWWFHRALHFFTGRPLQHYYVSTTRTTAAQIGYLILEYLEGEDEKMLSAVWDNSHEDCRLRHNLFRGLSRIMLSLSRIPLPRIGSWTIDEQGILSLSNRPLLHHLESLENEGVPTGIPRTRTYDLADNFYADLLSCHDNRILYQPNSILDEEDGHVQLASLFMMRGIGQNLTNSDLRYGPFAFTFTDLHTSNIFVDNDWNITHVIDLEWACSLPLEMHMPPYWLTNRGVDQLYDKIHLEKFDRLRQEFMKAFEEEEKQCKTTYRSATFRSDLMASGWRSGLFWYRYALVSPAGCYNLFRRNIKPIFTSGFDMEVMGQCIAPFWRTNAQDIVKGKLADKAKYERQLREVFTKSSLDEVNC